MEGWQWNDGASKYEISVLIRELQLELPADYLAFLEKHDGGEGFVNGQCLIIWRTEDIIRFNREYEVIDYDPDLLLIGSNGGGEAYAFDNANIADASGSSSIYWDGYRRHDCRSRKFLCPVLEGVAMRKVDRNQRPLGMELSGIKSIILGGDPSDPSNKLWLTRQQYIEAVRYWNELLEV